MHSIDSFERLIHSETKQVHASQCAYYTPGILKSGPLLQFSSNPDQTHLGMLISVFKIIRESQLGEFDQRCSSAADWPSRERLEEPCYTPYLLQIELKIITFRMDSMHIGTQAVTVFMNESLNRLDSFKRRFVHKRNAVFDLI